MELSLRCGISWRLIWLSGVMIAALAPLSGTSRVAAAEKVDFQSHVAPILAQHCVGCHYPGHSEGDISLATFADLSANEYVIPGDPDGSYLLELVTSVDGKPPAMPQEKPPLSENDVAVLRQWITQGADWPEGLVVREKSKADASLWSLQPLQGTEGDSIDHFIEQKLAEHHLAPNEEADRRTLIRRATFDLLGLPPTPEEVEAFVNDADPQAYEKLIERLLASPHYGERWGRHWLDVVRYADSNGLDENIAHGTAWRYRDYVIAAFNQDKPFDQFLVEQLAGDLLPAEDEPQRHEQLIATGMLTMGPKVLAEADKDKLQMDIIDEQIDTVGKAALGLTLGCARCHDHKFDPITTDDYYALAGIFKSTRTMESLTTIAKWNENEIATAEQVAARDAHLATVAAKKQEIDDEVATETARLKEAGTELTDKPETQFSPEVQAALKSAREELAILEKATPELPTAMGVIEGEMTNVQVHIGGSHLSLADEVGRGVPEVLRQVSHEAVPSDQSGRLEMARWMTSPVHPLTARVMVNRIWRWHFGRGLVATTDNFGILGEAPTHPELLDWLAARFIAEGWSVKQMHRLMMTSHTYRQASGDSAAGAEHDPDNRLWWRQNVKRLEAEAIRDAVLSVSGQLDKSMGGSHLHVANRAFLFDHTSKDDTSYASRQRSVYLPIIRNHLFDGFALFDYADASTPNGNRPTSTVATQALYALNSDLFLEGAEHLAARISQEAQPEARLQLACHLAWGRAPSSEEQQLFTQFLKNFPEQVSADEKTEPLADPALVALCQMILASNEFIYVR
ncbi:MAG: PSD1 and planctomycete cytochrome C domain-containing protein [Pirellulaceae bacterium]